MIEIELLKTEDMTKVFSSPREYHIVISNDSDEKDVAYFEGSLERFIEDFVEEIEN